MKEKNLKRKQSGRAMTMMISFETARRETRGNHYFRSKYGM